jgi:hypothetical protein
MDDTNQILMMARLLAVQAGVLAIIRALPRSPELVDLLNQEAERARAIMLARPISDETLATFENQLGSILLTVSKYHSPTA